MSTRILIVEGDESYRRFLEGFLRDREFDVAGVATHGMALQRLTNDYYDLAIVDFFIGEHSADELCREITGKLRETTTLIVTNHRQSPENERRIRAYSPALYLVRPFAIEDLYAVVLKVAGRCEQSHRSGMTRKPLRLAAGSDIVGFSYAERLL